MPVEQRDQLIDQHHVIVSRCRFCHHHIVSLNLELEEELVPQTAQYTENIADDG